MIGDLTYRVLSVSYRVWVALAVDPIASVVWLTCGLVMLAAASAGWWGLCRLDDALARRRRRRRLERWKAMERHPSAQSGRLRRRRTRERNASRRPGNRSGGKRPTRTYLRTSDSHRTERTQ